MIRSIWLCSPVPEFLDLESNAIDACRQSGVKHVLFPSSLGAADYPKSFPAWHRRVEDKLKSSGLGFTILRPNSFMQNIVSFLAPTVREQGAFFAAMGDARTSSSGSSRCCRCCRQDRGLPRGASAGKLYELNGPEAITSAELAQRIARICARPVHFVNIPEAAQRNAMLAMGMPEWQVDALLDLQRYYTNGQGGEVTGVLTQLLGRPPVKVDSFLEEFKDSFRTAVTYA